MNNFGLQFGYLAVQIINLAILVIWLGLVVYALASMNRRGLSTRMKAVWTLIIIGIPLLGALAFFIVHPNEKMAR